MRWFLSRVKIGVFYKTATETLFRHRTSHMISSRMLLLGETTKKTGSGKDDDVFLFFFRQCSAGSAGALCRKAIFNYFEKKL